MLFLVMAYSGISAETLDEYVRIALENTPGLNARYLEYESAKQKIPQAGALPDPVFSAGYSVTPVETRLGPQIARLSLSQTFPWFGTLKTQAAAAEAAANSLYEAFVDARDNMVFQVATAYYPLVELQRWRQIEQRNIDILESYKRLATIRFETAQGSVADVFRIDLMLNDARNNLNILDIREESLIVAFNKLLNREESSPIAIPEELPEIILPDESSRDSLLIENPVIKGFEFKIEAAQLTERASRKMGLPRFSIGLDYIVVGDRTDMHVADSGKDALIPMFSVSIPVFRSRYRSMIRESQLMQESYSLQKNEYSNRLTGNYEKTRSEIRQQQALIAHYRQQVEKTQAIQDLLMTDYSNSEIDIEKILENQQQLLRYEKMNATAEIRLHVASAKLNYLIAKN